MPSPYSGADHERGEGDGSQLYMLNRRHHFGLEQYVVDAAHAQEDSANDGRGLGLSDWNVADLSSEAFVRDLETVVDTLGLARFPLLGISGGAALAIAYAAKHPDRVSRLVLVAGFPHGWFKRGSAAEIAQRGALTSFIEANPAFHQLFTSQFVPGGTPEQQQWFKDLQRVTLSAENAIRLARMFGEIDVAELLPQVTAPTLVMHSRHDARVPFEQGLLMAREMPNARFIALDSANHIVLSHEPAWQRYLHEMCTFLVCEFEVRHIGWIGCLANFKFEKHTRINLF